MFLHIHEARRVCEHLHSQNTHPQNFPHHSALHWFLSIWVWGALSGSSSLQGLEMQRCGTLVISGGGNPAWADHAGVLAGREFRATGCALHIWH